jgi:hypothetical protein
VAVARSCNARAANWLSERGMFMHDAFAVHRACRDVHGRGKFAERAMKQRRFVRAKCT